MPLPFVRIEITDNIGKRREEDTGRGVSDADVGESCQNQSHLLPIRDHETSEEESISNLKERLRHAEIGCSRLEELYQKYRLRWLEESYRARVLEKHAPGGIDTCSPRQIAWDSPSPIQSDDEEE
ncbi:hypothetical protein P692DRAFT_20881013 [Suillus brevipes Sb2]|nr:hypothetical protein P692DRAFT_20881013 [Suillus brevipes Sb2]